MAIRILIVDDEPLVRTGLRTILSSDPQVDVVAEAGDGIDAIDMVRRHRPDVVFMDLHMPRMDGHAATRAIRAKANPPAVVVLTALNVDHTCMRALEAGACTFIVKASPNEDLLRAAKTALTDEPFYSPAAAKAMRAALRWQPADSSTREAVRQFTQLTDREQQIAKEVSTGASNREIALVLHVSEGTIKSHINQMLTKLDLTNRTQLAVLADRAHR